MDYLAARRRFAERLRQLRKAHGLTQEQLAEQLHKTTEHVSFLERAERAPSFDTILDLAAVFGVSVAALMNIDLPAVSDAGPHDRTTDLASLETTFEHLRAMQRLAAAYGITDILEDQHAKLLYVLVVLGLQRVHRETGPVVIDAEGQFHEVRIVTRVEGKPLSISTHRQLTHTVIERYRSMAAWIIAVYEGIELRVIYKVTPPLLEELFSTWDAAIGQRGPLNNPKIPMGLIKQGEVVYRNPSVPDEVPGL